MQFTYSLKAPGFNPQAFEAKTWSQAFAFKFNLYRYIMGLLAVAVRADGRIAPILGSRPRPSPPTPAEVCAALAASTRLTREMSRGQIKTAEDSSVDIAVPAPAAWEVGAAVAAAAGHLLTEFLTHAAVDEKNEFMHTFIRAGSSSGHIEMLLTAVHEAFNSAGIDAAAAAAADPELLINLRKIIIIAPIPIRTAAALAAGPIITATLAAAAAAPQSSNLGGLEDRSHFPSPPAPEPLTLKEAKSVMALMSISRDARTARAGAELLLAYSVAPGARQVMFDVLAVDKLVALLSMHGLDYNGARLAAAGTLWRLLFGPTAALPDFATDGGTTIDLHAAVSAEAEAAEAAMILAGANQVHESSAAVTTRPEHGRMHAPGGSERWRALRIMRDAKHDATSKGEGEGEAAFGDSDSVAQCEEKSIHPSNNKVRPRPLTAPTFAPSAPPMLKAAAHQIVRLLVLLVRRAWWGLCAFECNRP
jgi:hypothetical protein